jgi:hypothetical protein
VNKNDRYQARRFTAVILLFKTDTKVRGPGYVFIPPGKDIGRGMDE